MKAALAILVLIAALGFLGYQLAQDSDSFETLNEENSVALNCLACEHEFFVSQHALAERLAGRDYETAADGRTLAFKCESCGEYRAVRTPKDVEIDAAPPVGG